MMFGVLSSVLSGAAYGAELGNMVEGLKAGQDGHFCLAINVAAFTDLPAFRQRVDTIVREVRASRRAPVVDRVFAPGEIEQNTEWRYRAEGIPLAAATVDDLEAAAASIGTEMGTL